MAGKKNGGWKRRFDTGGGGAGVSGCLRTISHFTYEMVYQQGKLPWMAILGSVGQDVRCFRPIRMVTTILHFISKI